MRVIIVFFIIVSLFSTNVKKELSKTKHYIISMNSKLDKLAKEIYKKEKEIKAINKKISSLNKEIKTLEIELKNSNQIIAELNDLKKGNEEKLKSIKNEINKFISKNYYINSQEIIDINSLIKYYTTKEILKNYSNKIKNLIAKQKQLEKEINNINKKIENILNKQKLLIKKQTNLNKLLKQREKEISILKNKKKIYKQKLISMIKKAKNLQNQLRSLSVIKQTSKTLKTHYSYKGIKTIPPLKGKIVKKFGVYIDPIYKIKIYNNSITIKPYRKNEIVRNIMDGKVVYIGDSNGKKIVVIKHKNKIFSIYANLSKISPLLKKGKYVKRGTIIGRVEDTLEFEITFKDKPINPLKVISLK